MTSRPFTRQRGASMVVVLLLLLLAGVVALGGLRLLLSDQTITANDADQQRAHAAAQALLQDAERDIVCLNCRTTNAPFFPLRLAEYSDLHFRLSTASNQCAQGICAPSSADTLNDAFWTAVTPTSAMWGSGAAYGQFTGASDATGRSLASKASHARYWVEVMVYQDATSSNGAVVPDALTPFVYRITAIATGQKPGTKVVLQSVFVSAPRS